jgi:hypothetical protein
MEASVQAGFPMRLSTTLLLLLALPLLLPAVAASGWGWNKCDLTVCDYGNYQSNCAGTYPCDESTYRYLDAWAGADARLWESTSCHHASSTSWQCSEAWGVTASAPLLIVNVAPAATETPGHAECSVGGWVNWLGTFNVPLGDCTAWWINPVPFTPILP